MPYSLTELGFKPFFQQQLTLDDYDGHRIVRIIRVERSQYQGLGEAGEISLMRRSDAPDLAVGDWVVINDRSQQYRLLERLSEFSRKAPGSDHQRQLISANVDTVFIVSSLNHDFSLNRIERYLALAHDAGATPVIVLTKADLVERVEDFVDQIQSLDPFLEVAAVNALSAESCSELIRWCSAGATVAAMGSSGVGKSTLINTLIGDSTLKTGAIREEDSKGRHTTTHRSIHATVSGAWLIDTPGMRELQLADCEDGVRETFSDIEGLVDQCRFSDCQHGDEPGCAVRVAIESGELDERRLSSYKKLLREQAHNGATLAEQRAHSKSLSKMYRRVQGESRSRKSGR